MNNYIPYLIFEDYFRKKLAPRFEQINYFLNYLSNYFNVDEDRIGIETILAGIKLSIYDYDYEIEIQTDGTINCYIKKDGIGERLHYLEPDCKLKSFQKSKKTRENVEKYILPLIEDDYYSFYKKVIKTNYNNIFVSISANPFGYTNIEIYDNCDNNAIYSIYIERNKEQHSNNPRHRGNNRKEYTEEEIGKILTSLKVDISKFEDKYQDEINHFYMSNLGNLDSEKESKLNEYRQLQIDKILLAYKKIKEAIELLNNTQINLQFEKIEIDNIRTILFKNNGYPTEKGYIEFDEMFRNNMILRMIKLSTLDLKNVDIRYMDFSGTDIHFNPQTIYNRDMTGVNALGVHFSPFTDNFEDTILDDAIINDYEAMIYLDRVRSYNERTQIKKEAINKLM